MGDAAPHASAPPTPRPAWTPERRTARGRWLAVLLITALLGVATGWAAAHLLRPPTAVPGEADHALVEVVQGSVGSALTLNTVATWEKTSSVENQAAGVVTTLGRAASERVAAGDTLYTVGLRPVVAAHGDVPAFREVSAGAHGQDVSQLQQLLKELGFLQGGVTGRVDERTVRAIRAWQKKVGGEATGSVGIGDVMYFPSLPARVALDAEAVAVGRRLNGGEPVASLLEPAPRFALPVTRSQATLITEGTAVTISAPEGGSWEAVAGPPQQGESAEAVTIPLAGAHGRAVCEDACASIPVAGTTRLPAKVIVVPTQSGPVVPTAAIVTGADGTPAVMDEAGDLVPVTVVASAQGLSIIEGLSPGVRVRVQRR